MLKPQVAAARCTLAAGVDALPGGFALLTASRTLVCADVHFGYEDVIAGGGALPLWSTAESASAIAVAAQRYGAREIVILGDAIHASRMSSAAASAVRGALDALRAIAVLTIVAGNHEGRSRGAAILGETVEACDRDGWRLVHGDKAHIGETPAMIGHLHPSLGVGGGATVPAFLGAQRLVVLPAVTPYSAGLDVTGADCAAALGAWGVERAAVHVVAVTAERVFPFGSLSRLAGLSAAAASRAGRRRVLRPDR
ncbi:MAG TPA: hypothetical protein VGN14_09035 [Candidatus Elarobacter sp.]|jgi:metallophosphoesterase superfamily enzyme